MFVQAPHLLAMLEMSGNRKKEACDKLGGFETQVGAAGLIQIVKCGGDFPKAFERAKAFCGSGAAPGNSTKGNSTKPGAGADGGHMCNIAKAQVRVRAFMCVCVCRTKIREKVSVR